jgi:PhzF family phenazine biosynthesis protein
VTRRVRVFQVDAFTNQLFTGNPASVVLDAQLLRDDEMQQIARELASADSAFVLPADGADHDLRLRFFTPRGEAAFIGHATIAVHAVLDGLGLGPCRLQKQRIGLVETGRIAGPQGTLYSFGQPPPPVQGPLPGERLLAVLGALGLQEDDLDPGSPAVIAGAGAARALLAVRDGAVLARLRPDFPRLAALSAAGLPPGYFIYTLAPSLPECDTEARMFCPAIGIAEDPVSGNAHAMLAVHLQALQRIPERSGRLQFTGRQGHHLGRPGVVQVSLEREAGAVRRILVAGAACIVLAGAIELPQARD